MTHKDVPRKGEKRSKKAKQQQISCFLFYQTLGGAFGKFHSQNQMSVTICQKRGGVFLLACMLISFDGEEKERAENVRGVLCLIEKRADSKKERLSWERGGGQI